jgi:uncharacterized protein YlxW (UPF0749 family)
MDNTQLQNQIAELNKAVIDLQNQINNMGRSSSFPNDVEDAIRERLGDFTGATGTGTTPAGTIAFVYQGKAYNILIT